MFSPVYDRSEPFAGGTDETWNIATDPFMTAILVDPVPTGDLAYDCLTDGTQVGFVPQFFDWLGPSFLIDDTSNICVPPLGYVPEEPIPSFTIPSPSSLPSYFPLTPSPPPSQTSTPECYQPVLPQPEPSCDQARPLFESIRGKWCCNACGRDFRGHWECKRHILNAGKRAICLACNKKINRRDDSLRRHYYKHCKRMDLGRDSEDVGLEDAFVHV